MLKRATVATIAIVAIAGAAIAGVALAGPGGMQSAGPGAGQSGAMGGMGGMAGMGMEVESEFDYLTQMIPHHEEAIAAAKVLQARTERPELRRFAAAIIETQTTEVKQIEQWLAAWYPGRDTSIDYEPMMRDLTGLSGDALDRAFLEDMIPHHMMAVMMSQRLLAADLAEHHQVVHFAENIRDTQRREIRTMARWLRDWYGTAPCGMGTGMGTGMSMSMAHGAR